MASIRHALKRNGGKKLSEYLNQIQARKERLQRFAEAASRHANKASAQADIQQSAILDRCLETPPKRREYETASKPSPHMPIARRIMHAVANEFGISIAQMIGRNRSTQRCLPRYVAVGLMLEMTQMSLPAIGRRLGGRDHTVIIHHRQHAFRLFAEEAFRNRVDQIKMAVLA